MQRRQMLRGILGIALAAVAAVSASAANVHFKPKGASFTDNGTTLTACASLAGLGNGDVTVTVNTSGTASVYCINPGSNEPPGQNKVPVQPSGQITIPADYIKNGNVSFCVTTIQPVVTPKEAGCPNDNWTVEVRDVQFARATITVEQFGKVVLQQGFKL